MTEEITHNLQNLLYGSVSNDFARQKDFVSSKAALQGIDYKSTDPLALAIVQAVKGPNGEKYSQAATEIYMGAYQNVLGALKVKDLGSIYTSLQEVPEEKRQKIQEILTSGECAEMSFKQVRLEAKKLELKSETAAIAYEEAPTQEAKDQIKEELQGYQVALEKYQMVQGIQQELEGIWSNDLRHGIKKQTHVKNLESLVTPIA